MILCLILIAACDSPPSDVVADLAAPDLANPCHDFPEGHGCCLGADYERGGCLPGLECFYTGPGVGTECVRPCGADAGMCGGGVACRVHIGGFGMSGCFCELPSDAEDRTDGGLCP